MENEKVFLMIQDFFDGELAPSKEADLFAKLAEDNEYRAYFKKLHLLKEAAEADVTDFPVDLEERIFHSIEQKEAGSNKGFKGMHFPAPLAYAAIFAAIIFGLLFFLGRNGESGLYEYRYREALNTIQQQNLKIELLLNSYSGAEVTDYVPNKIIVKPSL